MSAHRGLDEEVMLRPPVPAPGEQTWAHARVSYASRNSETWRGRRRRHGARRALKQPHPGPLLEGRLRQAQGRARHAHPLGGAGEAAGLIVALDARIRDGAEDPVTDTVHRDTGRPPRRFEDFAASVASSLA